MLSTRTRFGPEASLLWLALLLLAVGVAVYVLDRGGSTYFLPAWLARETGPPVFGAVGDRLPTFLHPFAFVLITAVVLWPWPQLLPVNCATWFVLECAFEFGQLESLGTHIAAAMPAWFGGVPLLEATGDYFELGTFDPLDVLSIALGVLAAYLVVRILRRGETP